MWNSGSVRAQHVVGAHAEHARAVDAPPVELRVRADHALGRPGGARGVEDGERHAGADRRSRNGIAARRVRLAAHTGIAGAPPASSRQPPHRLQGGARQVRLRQPRRECALDQQQPGAAVGQVVRDLRPHRRGVDRHRHGAQPAAGQEGFQQLDPVGAHQRDPVAEADAGGQQRGGAPRHVGGRVGVRPGSAGHLSSGRWPNSAAWRASMAGSVR